ncbi:hypothetical protein GTW43_31240 [Streptomyces sp. SID5785]|uniref:hypothetical protein n=1 Tax=Streptomyces sp. SID5785 TaxID=2690309 RepID=UPI0013610C21|nr:hypothetical protein [Streptomyces sp. SID5785]MZD09520.1 hypothetical protein [Streptomyces sp. SID5785]
MAMVPWDVRGTTGRLAVLAAAVATVLVTSARLRPRRGAAGAGTAGRVRPRIVPARPVPGPVTEHGAAVGDLCTCVSELASDLAKRYGDAP